MAFVLVQWIKDKRTSVIPTAWVVSPNPLPATLPAPGLCYWRRKTSRWETNIIASSDSKQELEQLTIGEETRESMNDEACTTNGASSNDVVNSKARKEKKEIEKKKKEARIAVANETAEKIFSMAPCEECIGLTSELQKIQKALKEKEVLIKGLESSAQAEKCIGLTSELQKVQETLKEKEVLIKDLESSVQAKKRVIKDLESELKAKKTKVAEIPLISHQSLLFLENLTSFYCNQPEYINSDESSDEEVPTLEMRRARNIARNKAVLSQIKACQGTKENTATNPSFTIPTSAPQASSTSSTASTSGSSVTPYPFKVVSPGLSEASTSGSSLLSKTSGSKRSYNYNITPADLAREQQAFTPGEGKKELVDGFGVYIKYVDLEMAEHQSKNSATGLMRTLISVWYSKERLAACSLNSGINDTIKTAIFKYCEKKFNLTSVDKLKRDLTSKCGEERRKMLQ